MNVLAYKLEKDKRVRGLDPKDILVPNHKVKLN